MARYVKFALGESMRWVFFQYKYKKQELSKECFFVTAHVKMCRTFPKQLLAYPEVPCDQHP